MKTVSSLIYLLVFTAGFTVMLVEMSAPRLLAPAFGSTTAIWTIVIGVILTALSLGYYIGGWLADRNPDPARLCLIVMGGCGITALIPVFTPLCADWIVPTNLTLETARNLPHTGTLVTALVVFFPPALVLAMVGPYAITCLASADKVGQSAGTVYALSTIGSLLGTFTPTFFLIPWLGSRTTILMATGLLFAVALIGYGVLRGRRQVASS